MNHLDKRPLLTPFQMSSRQLNTKEFHKKESRKCIAIELLIKNDSKQQPADGKQQNQQLTESDSL